MIITQLNTAFALGVLAICIGFTGLEMAPHSERQVGLADQSNAHSDLQVASDAGAMARVITMEYQEATYKGGKKAMREVLKDSFIQLIDESDTGNEGLVLVRFTIGADGSVHSTRVIRSQSRTIDTAVLAAVRSLTDWKPGTEDGIPVASNVVIPFKVAQ